MIPEDYVTIWLKLLQWFQLSHIWTLQYFSWVNITQSDVICLVLCIVKKKILTESGETVYIKQSLFLLNMEPPDQSF